MLPKLLWLAMAGALGTLSRYGLSGLVQRLAGSAFPWGTVVVNVIGCFVFGLLWTILEARMAITGEIRAIVFIGFMGAFTTFSTFIFETNALLQDSEWLPALGNLAIQNLIGFAFLFMGLAIGRLV
ncbi:CrcB family protein [bacterium]|nr:CrcB family protein [bacterium]